MNNIPNGNNSTSTIAIEKKKNKIIREDGFY